MYSLGIAIKDLLIAVVLPGTFCSVGLSGHAAGYNRESDPARNRDPVFSFNHVLTKVVAPSGARRGQCRKPRYVSVFRWMRIRVTCDVDVC